MVAAARWREPMRRNGGGRGRGSLSPRAAGRAWHASRPEPAPSGQPRVVAHGWPSRCGSGIWGECDEDTIVVDAGCCGGGAHGGERANCLGSSFVHCRYRLQLLQQRDLHGRRVRPEWRRRSVRERARVQQRLRPGRA